MCCYNTMFKLQQYVHDIFLFTVCNLGVIIILLYILLRSRLRRHRGVILYRIDYLTTTISLRVWLYAFVIVAIKFDKFFILNSM